MKLAWVQPLAFARSPGQEALDQGTQYFKEGRYEEALTAFKKATTLDPAHMKAWENLGWAYYKSGQMQEALRTWETILKVDPENRKIRNAVGFLLMEENQWRRAIRHLNESLRLEPAQTLVRFRLGKALQKMGRTGRARDLFKSVLELQPDHWEAFTHLADAYESLRQRDLSISLLKNYLDSYSTFPNEAKFEWVAVRLSSLYARQGDEFYQQGQFQKAEAVYRQALNWEPDHRTRLDSLGWALEKQGKYDEAVKAWLKIVDQGFTGFQLFHQIASAYYHSGQTSEAEVWYQNAARMDSSGENLHFRLFELALKEKRVPRAVTALRQAFRSDTADREWSLTAANQFIRHETIDQGLEFFLQRLPHSSNSEVTNKALARLYSKMGARERKAGNVPHAILNYEKSLSHDDKNSAAYRDLGWLYWNAGERQESEKIWKRYQKQFPGKAEPYNLLARFYLDQGDYEKSLSVLERSLKVAPNQPDQKLLEVKALYWVKQYPEALGKMSRIVREFPGHLPIQYFYGEVLMQGQDFKRGLAQWRSVLDMGSNSPRAYFYWIQCLYEMGEYETSVKEAKNFISQNGPYKPIIKFLADDALFRRDQEQAVFWYETLLKNHEDQAGDWLLLAKLYVELDRLADADSLLKKAQKKFPDDVGIQLSIGDLQVKDNKYEDALAVFKDIGKIHPDNRRAFIGTFHSLKALGRMEEAMRHLQSKQEIFFKDYEVNLEMGNLMTAMNDLDAAKRYYWRVANPAEPGKYIPILLYHGLSGHARNRNLWVERFDEQLKALVDAGFTSLTVAELGDALNNKRPLPEKPILITFDDGRRDAFRLGDPILKKYGMKATMFVPTARIHDGAPFFADWNRFREYAGSGRWDLQAHGHEAHDRVAIDSKGGEGNFLTNFRWLNKNNRQETATEFYARLDGDYQRNINLLKTEIPGLSVVGYAYPFSEAGQSRNGNADSARAVNRTLLQKYFKFGFIQDSTGYNQVKPGDSNTSLLRRFSVPRDWDGDRLVRHLVEAHPSHMAQVAMAKSQYWNGHYSDAEKTFSSLILREPRLKDKLQFYLADISYQGGNTWDSENLLDGIPDQESVLNPKVEALREALAWRNRPRVLGRFNFFRDSNDRSNHSQSAKVYFPLKVPLELALEGGILDFKEKGRPDIDGGHVSAGLHWRGWNFLQLEGKLRHRTLSQRKDTQNYWMSAKYQRNVHTFQFNGARQDIDTVQAIENGIQVKTYSLGYQTRFSPALLGKMGMAYQDYDDGNAGFDIRTGLRYRLPGLKNWKIGADLSFRDSDFEAREYYTPDQLLIGFARILYQRKLGQDAEVRADLGLGGADDKVHGVRWATNGGFNFDYFLTRKLKAGLATKFSVVPGYDSVNLQAVLGYRF
ncbi:MAG: hypothetical protein NPINA01_22360 [Nitrospinaceae bacterium]|nr:MAG: hypothetical protein NPINA01_22360 [Nitrospinaceae bacterium]